MKQFILQKVVGNEYTTIGVYQQKETAVQEGVFVYRIKGKVRGELYPGGDR